MSEKVFVRQNKNFEVSFWAVNPEKPDSDDFQPVHALHEVTPYGMLLISLATCTAQVVLTYAQHLAHHCPIEKIYKQGIQIHSELNTE